jgi:hypothetical protein
MKMALYVDIGVFGRLSRFPCVYLTTEALLIFVISNWYVFAVLHYRSLEGTWLIKVRGYAIQWPQRSLKL